MADERAIPKPLEVLSTEFREISPADLRKHQATITAQKLLNEFALNEPGSGEKPFGDAFAAVNKAFKSLPSHGLYQELLERKLQPDFEKLPPLQQQEVNIMLLKLGPQNVAFGPDSVPQN